MKLDLIIDGLNFKINTIKFINLLGWQTTLKIKREGEREMPY